MCLLRIVCYSFLFISLYYADHRNHHVLTHSVPTRRASDLQPRSPLLPPRPPRSAVRTARRSCRTSPTRSSRRTSRPTRPSRKTRSRPSPSRSEEHTSELQSLMRISYAVFCLKKKNIHHIK